jgi:septum formation protein
MLIMPKIFINIISLASPMRIILASQSLPRRRALDLLGIDYETIPSNIDESSIRDDDPWELAKSLAEAKAKKIAEANSNSVIIASDLLVVAGCRILEKPEDDADAFVMLNSLSNKTFDIITGLAVFNSATEEMLSTAESCRVTFRDLEEKEIKDYIRRFPATKCAGAFETNGLLWFADSISGNYNFHTALPVNKLVLFLRKNNIDV